MKIVCLMGSVELSGTLTTKYVFMILAGGGIGHKSLDGIGNTGGCIDFGVAVEARVMGGLFLVMHGLTRCLLD